MSTVSRLVEFFIGRPRSAWSRALRFVPLGTVLKKLGFLLNKLSTNAFSAEDVNVARSQPGPIARAAVRASSQETGDSPKMAA